MAWEIEEKWVGEDIEKIETIIEELRELKSHDIDNSKGTSILPDEFEMIIKNLLYLKYYLEGAKKAFHERK